MPEQGWITAVTALYPNADRVGQRTRVDTYESAMADLVARVPTDTEAMIFHAITLAAAAPPIDKTYPNQLRTGAALESLWVRHPDHPVSHTTSSTRTTCRRSYALHIRRTRSRVSASGTRESTQKCNRPPS